MEMGGNNLVKLFRNKDFGEIRVVFKDGEPWFAAKDVAQVVEISKYRDMLSNLDDDERTYIQMDTQGGRQNLSFINESGMYEFMIRSKSPKAKPFRKWLTKTVLPAIRKTGSYSIESAVPHLTKEESTKRRNKLTSQWHIHGAIGNHQYRNLTENEYKGLFGDRKIRKYNMNDDEIALLGAFEILESFRLASPDNHDYGYYQLRDSSTETAEKIMEFLPDIKRKRDAKLFENKSKIVGDKLT